MDEYYKGYITNVTNLKNISYNLDVLNNSEEYINKISKYLSEVVINGLSNSDQEYLDKCINDDFRLNSSCKKEVGILYQKVYDMDGNCYGKELLTDLIFPLSNNYDFYNITYSKGIPHYIYYDRISDILYSANSVLSNNNYCLMNDALRFEQSMSASLISGIQDIMPNQEKKIRANGRNYSLTCLLPKSYVIDVKPKSKFVDDNKISYIITNENKANLLEVHNYFKMHESGFINRSSKEDFHRKLHDLYSNNNIKIIEIDNNDKSLVKKMI